MRRSLRSLRPRRYGNSSGGQAHSRLARLGICCFRSGWGGLSPDRHCRHHRLGEIENGVGAGLGGEHGCQALGPHCGRGQGEGKDRGGGAKESWGR